MPLILKGGSDNNMYLFFDLRFYDRYVGEGYITGRLTRERRYGVSGRRPDHTVFCGSLSFIGAILFRYTGDRTQL